MEEELIERENPLMFLVTIDNVSVGRVILDWPWPQPFAEDQENVRLFLMTFRISEFVWEVL